MKIRVWLLLVLLVSPLLSAQVQYPPRMIPLSSPVYAQAELLYRLNGLALPSGSKPWSTAEAAAILDAVPAHTAHQKLLDATKALVETSRLKEKSQDFSYLLSTTVDLEAYTHTNTTDFVNTYDWIYSYDDRRPLVQANMELLFSNHFYFATGVEVGTASYSLKDKGKTTDFTTDIGALFTVADGISQLETAYRYQNAFITNLILPSLDNMQADWPKEAQLSLGGPWWYLSVGRSRIRWGNGSTGNLVIGDHINGHTYLMGSVISDAAKLQFMYLFMPDPSESGDQRIFLGHRLETHPVSWARFTVTENVMYKNDSLLLLYFNPTYIYHNLYDGSRLNSIASIEFDVVVVPSVSLHAQFALDQFQLANETGSEANATGMLLQSAYSWKQGDGYWTLLGEYVSTDPSFYRRNNIDFMLARGLNNNWPPVIIDYLGYQYGSDSKVYALKLSYQSLKGLQLDLSALVHRQGAVDRFGLHNPDGNQYNSTIKGPSPSGDDITERLIFGVKASYDTTLAGLTIYSQANWIGRRHYYPETATSDQYAQDLQLVVGMSLTF
ncbi:MAG: hypothetical protein AB7C91_09675 [Sphaerochaeta sp.]|uniref:hypothetical protein n=1 Tax=Sphaerochaeta sp. TaxID=1972642 RepID=UPI003D0B9499